MKPKEIYRTWSKSRAPRLPRPAYRHGFPVHLVLCTQERRPIFAELPPLATFVFERQARLPETLAFCLMPEHLHWLVEAVEPPAVAVKALKLASFHEAARLGFHHRLWQRSYFDRVIWSSDALVAEVRYILANPVRAGLVGEPAEWPYGMCRPGYAGG
jgi:putative transposase